MDDMQYADTTWQMSMQGIVKEIENGCYYAILSSIPANPTI